MSQKKRVQFHGEGVDVMINRIHDSAAVPIGISTGSGIPHGVRLHEYMCRGAGGTSDYPLPVFSLLHYSYIKVIVNSYF